MKKFRLSKQRGLWNITSPRGNVIGTFSTFDIAVQEVAYVVDRYFGVPKRVNPPSDKLLRRLLMKDGDRDPELGVLGRDWVWEEMT